MPDKMFILADKEGIGCSFFDLPYPLLGLYDSRPSEQPIILLDNSLKKNRKLLRCVFAEELGHHFTTGFDLMAFARSDKQYIVAKHEKLAIFWAVEYLMPLDKLIEAINSGLFLTHEIAEYFDVTCRFAGTGIKLYFEKRRNAMLKLLKKLPEELNNLEVC